MQELFYILILIILIIIKPKYTIYALPLIALIYLASYKKNVFESLENEITNALQNNPFNNSLPPPRHVQKALKKDEMCNVQLPFDEKHQSSIKDDLSFKLYNNAESKVSFQLPEEKVSMDTPTFKLPFTSNASINKEQANNPKNTAAYKIMEDFVLKNDKIQKYYSEILDTELDDIDIDIDGNRSFYKIAGATNVDAYDEALKFLYPTRKTCKEDTEECYY